MSRRACLCAAAGLFLIAACNNSSTTPTTTLPATTTTSLIGPATATVLVIGQTQVYSLVPGSTTANVLSWTSSNSGVLTINSSGLALGIASGVTTLTVSLDDGTSSTLTVQVVPNYQGSWAGTSTVLACTDVDGFTSAGYCSQIRGKVQQWTLTLVQSGLALSGTMTKSEGANVLNGNVTASVGGSGDIIAMTGPLGGVAGGTTLLVTPITWDSFATGSSMTGAWAANVTSPQIVGNATVQWSLNGAAQVSASGARDTSPRTAVFPLRRPAR